MNQDCTVECRTCGKQQRVNFGVCLSSGWPKCHGSTMKLITPAQDIDVDGAIRRVIDKGMMASYPPPQDYTGERKP